MNPILVWLLDKVAERDEIKTYLGHGDFTAERGWWLFGHWISYDERMVARVSKSDGKWRIKIE